MLRRRGPRTSVAAPPVRAARAARIAASSSSSSLDITSELCYYCAPAGSGPDWHGERPRLQTCSQGLRGWLLTPCVPPGGLRPGAGPALPAGAEKRCCCCCYCRVLVKGWRQAGAVMPLEEKGRHVSLLRTGDVHRGHFKPVAVGRPHSSLPTTAQTHAVPRMGMRTGQAPDAHVGTIACLRMFRT